MQLLQRGCKILYIDVDVYCQLYLVIFIYVYNMWLFLLMGFIPLRYC